MPDVSKLPLYQSHKIVRAAKIKDVILHAHPSPEVSLEEFVQTPEFTGGHLIFHDDSLSPLPVSAEWCRKHEPTRGGYLVAYADGYLSFSPQDAFRSGYRSISEAEAASAQEIPTPTREIFSHRCSGLNEALRIYVLDSPGPGNACHDYQVVLDRNKNDTELPVVEVCRVQFQKGAVQEAGLNGLSNEALLAIVEDRLTGFQTSQFSCRENAVALTKIQEAMMWLQKRTRDRLARGVEGTHTV